ncbi:P-loop containing nucleoside triphosphate hydrolase protein [Pelagophyceae sp. CCMP2097]|nr:P-loop containing nucleoside triphosphate hydrolase protein [Pelagophyceae sp. CCMP2097]
MSADGAAWREDSVLKLAKTAAETLEIALADAVAANGGKPLSSKVKRKVEKDFAGRARDAAELAAKEAASVEGAQFACSQSAVNEDSPEWQNALDVKIESFSISAAGKTLFDNSPLSIVHGRRYGIVGPNGRGKTTLLKMIASGELKTPPRVGCLYVEQEVVADGTRAVDAVLRADTERASLLDEEAKLLKSLETGKSHVDGTKLNNEGLREVSERLSLVGEELKAIGAASAEAKARRILFGLGFSPEMQMRETKLFSGGWRMRISLARALFMEPVLLMLDEPTNHLDLNAVIWLDDYLQRYKHTLIVVSHDQDFLNSVCDEILHISEERTLDQYRGNYDTFKTLELQKRNAQMKAWEKQEKAIKVLKGKSNTKTKAEELVKKMQASKAGREPGARKKKDQAIALGTDSADVATLIEKPKEYLVEMSFPPVTKLSPPVLQVVDATFRYSPELPYIFNDMNFGVDQDSRICIVGKSNWFQTRNNGSGKTTLLQLMIGKLAPTEGEVKRNNRLRMGVYNQHFVERLPMDECPIDYLRRLFNDETYQSVRNMLGRYGLEGHAHSIAMRDLSGGQKARVVLVELSLYAPHMLLLDEPTNNLDIETIDALCTAIKEYDGGVICVTHDARLIEATNMRLWVVENRCVTEWGEPFSKYREHLLEKLEAAMASDDQRVTAAGLSVDMGGNRS